MARWPGSSLWFEGTIVDMNDREYQIQFTDEGQSEYVIKHKDVKVSPKEWFRNLQLAYAKC